MTTTKKMLEGMVSVLFVLFLCVPGLQAKDKSEEATHLYAQPVNKVFLASAQVAAMKWNVTHSDKDTYTLSFVTGSNMRTNKGFEMSVVCFETEPGKTQVKVHPQKRPSMQIFSWGEGGRITKQFFEALDERIAEITPAPQTSTQPSQN